MPTKIIQAINIKPTDTSNEILHSLQSDCSQNTNVALFIANLIAGTNYVTIPRVPADNSPSNVFRSITSYLDPDKALWLYKDATWYWWKPGVAQSTLTSVYPGYEYVIYMAQAATLTIM